MDNDYPKWIYSRDGESRIVKTRAEHDKYPAWRESPAEFAAVEEPATAPKPIPDEVVPDVPVEPVEAVDVVSAFANPSNTADVLASLASLPSRPQAQTGRRARRFGNS